MTRKKLQNSVQPAPAAIKIRNGNNARPGAIGTKQQKPVAKANAVISAARKSSLLLASGSHPKVFTAISKMRNGEATTAAALPSTRQSALSCQSNRPVRKPIPVKNGSCTRRDAQCSQGLDATPGLALDLSNHRGPREHTVEVETAQPLCHKIAPSKGQQGTSARPGRCAKRTVSQAGGTQAAKGDIGNKPARKHDRSKAASRKSTRRVGYAEAAKGHECGNAATGRDCTKEASSGMKRKLAQDLIVQGKRKRREPKRPVESKMVVTSFGTSPEHHVADLRSVSPEGEAIARNMRQLEEEFDESLRPLLDQDKGLQKSLRKQVGKQSHLAQVMKMLEQPRSSAMNNTVAAVDLPWLPSPGDTADDKIMCDNGCPPVEFTSHDDSEANRITSSDLDKGNGHFKSIMHENVHAIVSELDDKVLHKDAEILDLRKQLQLMTEQNAAFRTRADRLQAEIITLQELLRQEKAEVAKQQECAGLQKLGEAKKHKAVMEACRMLLKACKNLGALSQDFEDETSAAQDESEQLLGKA